MLEPSPVAGGKSSPSASFQIMQMIKLISVSPNGKYAALLRPQEVHLFDLEGLNYHGMIPAREVRCLLSLGGGLSVPSTHTHICTVHCMVPPCRHHQKIHYLAYAQGSGPSTVLEFGPLGDVLAIGTANNSLFLYNVASRQLVDLSDQLATVLQDKLGKMPGSISCIAFTPDSKASCPAAAPVKSSCCADKVAVEACNSDLLRCCRKNWLSSQRQAVCALSTLWLQQPLLHLGISGSGGTRTAAALRRNQTLLAPTPGSLT